MRLKKILRIGIWEIEHQYREITAKQTIAFVLILGLSFSLFTFVGTNAVLQDRLYEVGVSSDSPYYNIVENTPELVPITVEEEEKSELQKLVNSERIDIMVTDDGKLLLDSGSQESGTAASILRQSIIDSNRNKLDSSGYEEVAYPVLARLEYQEQSQPQNSLIEGPTDDTQNNTNTDNNQDTNENDANQSESDETTDETKQETQEPANNSNDGGYSVFDDEDDSGLSTPSNLQPPFPLQSIVFGFLFLVPMNFIVQTYASSVFDERIDYSGELLLVTPVSRYEIIVGKTLPYLTAIIGIATITALFVGAGILSVLAVGTIGVTFLASGFITGIFARSYRELTFVFLTLSLSLFGFVLIPAVFTTIHPIAIISPLTVVVSQLEGEILTNGDLVFSMLPITLTGIIIYIYGSGIYEEEDLFTERRVPRKFLDVLSNQVRSWKSLLIVGTSVLPFVFVAQLLLIAVLFAVPESLALPAILIFAALIEEFAKSVPVYAGVIDEKLVGRKEKYFAAAMSGLGFFIGEQITTIAQLVGLLQIEIGSAVFGGTLAQVTTSTPLGFLIPVLWIAVHPVTTMVDSVGIQKGHRWYILTLVLGTLLHLAYNFAVIIYA